MKILNPLKLCFRNLLLNPAKLPNSSSFTVHSISTASKANNLLVDFFHNQLGFPKTKASSLATRYPHIKSLERPQSSIQLLKSLGLSDIQIRNVIRIRPRVIISDIDKTLKPKIRFLQEVGFSGLDLAQFLSTHPSVLYCSVQDKMAPSLEVIKTKLLPDDKSNEQLIKVLKKCSWLLMRDPQLFLCRNISFLESCGISGSQLTCLLKTRPSLFISSGKNLKVCINQALDFGFKIRSRMLVYALSTLYCLSAKTLKRKFQFFSSYGFSKNETLDMFRKCPSLLAAAPEKLKRQMEYYMNTLGFEKEAFVKRPMLLIFSLEERVIPRFNVLEVLIAKELLKKKPSLNRMIEIPEKDFVNKFILQFGSDKADELLVAYKGRRKDNDPCSSEGENV